MGIGVYVDNITAKHTGLPALTAHLVILLQDGISKEFFKSMGVKRADVLYIATALRQALHVPAVPVPNA